MTLTDHWQKFLDIVYPGQNYTEEQKKQLHRAFFAGALALKKELFNLTPLSEEESMRVLDRLHREINTTARAIISSTKDRN